jgi:hypothetical protein
VVFALIVLAVACFTLGTLGLSATQDSPTPDPDEYQFVEDTTLWVDVIQGDTESIGKLDAAGNFIPDKRYFRSFKKGQPRSAVPPCTLINSAQKGIYEFRSGRLIPGDLDDDGNFIPAVGGRIIDFKDYRYGPKAAKIYNLPGKFVRKEKTDSKK